MLSWAIWLYEAFGYVWSLGLVGLAAAIWFGAFSLPPFIRATTQQVAIALLVFAGCTFLSARIYSDGIHNERAKWDADKKVEDDRREQTLLDTQREFQKTIDAFDDERTVLKEQLHASEAASHTHDSDPGLPVDSVLRLKTVTGSRPNGARATTR